MSKTSAAIVYANYTNLFSYFDDWLDAFSDSELFSVDSYDCRNSESLSSLKRNIINHDLIVVLHSVLGDSIAAAAPLIPILQNRKCKLVSFVGNEVNIPGSKISDKRAWLEAVQPEYIATQLLIEAGEYLFADIATQRVIALPHALNPNAFKPPPPDHRRTIDIGVRNASYLPHLGDNDRNRINEYFANNHQRLGLLADISSGRLDRQGWAGFLQNCVATISTEAGGWYLEKNDETVEDIRHYLNDKTGSSVVLRDDSALVRFYNKLPGFIRAPLRLMKSSGFVRHEFALDSSSEFERVYEKFFRDKPKPAFYGKCISSRHFDAVGTKTAQVMFPGRYNDILKAGEHFIELRQDFSNIETVVEQLKDEDYIRDLVIRSYEFVMDKHTYAHRITQLYEQCC